MALRYVAALLPSLAFALPQQSLDDVPPCAFPPLLASLSGTSCDQTDIACICAQKDIIPTITTNVVAACPGTLTADDVTGFIAELCGSTAPSPESSSSVAESVTSAASSATTAAATTSTTGVITTDGSPLITTTANASSAAASTTVASSTTSSAGNATTTPSDGSAEGLRSSLMAAAVALVGLTWVFAEL
ncbi:hypothetical protein CKM354_000108200 [Cercospora kikuchii]|uniref:CFEM domain-containing protein n=1 Tax=Cercospora kikuchii TaxID=84275 RepID=A0A9P3CC52_9PEZI|nr:uncharacterized protein CKM354_000108200 [Cercospora kikuchii]GIZ37640.1 hypothetical protein CKM354_000108200 [Cercospora kikuchii]